MDSDDDASVQDNQFGVQAKLQRTSQHDVLAPAVHSQRGLGDQYEVQFDSDFGSDIDDGYNSVPFEDHSGSHGVKRRASEVQFNDQYEVQFDSDSDCTLPFSDSDE